MTDETMTPDAEQPGAGGAMPDYAAAADSFFNGGAQRAQAVQVGNNLASVAGLNPAQEAKYQQLSRITGTPVDSVRGNADAVYAQAQLHALDTDALVAQYPHTANLLTDPNKAAVAHDDVSTLTGIEGTLAANGRALAGVPMALLRGLGGSFNTLLGSAGIVTAAPAVALDKLHSAITGRTETGLQDWWFGNTAAPWINNASEFDEGPNAPLVLKAANAAGRTVGMLSQIVLTGGGSAAAGAAGAVAAPAADATVGSIAASALTHGTAAMAPVAVSDAVDTARRVYENTGNAAQALKAAQMQYVTSTLGGVVPLSAGGSLMQRMAVGMAAGAATSESSRQLMNSALPLDMQQPFDIDNAVIGMLTGGILGAGGAPGEPAFHDQVRQVYATAIKAAEAEQNMQRLQALSKLSTESNLRKNSPDDFKAFLDAAAENTDLRELWVDGKALDNALHQSGLTRDQLAQTMPVVADQLHTAVQTDGLVRIPAADYFTHISGSPVEEALTPHLRTEPDGMTFGESQDFYQRHEQELEAQAKAITEQADQISQHDAESQAIHDDILQKLEQAGVYSRDVNNVIAILPREYYVTTAGRVGTTPAKLYADRPLNIEGILRNGAAILNQREVDPYEYALAGWKVVGKDEDAARYPVSDAAEFPKVMADIDPGMRVHEDAQEAKRGQQQTGRKVDKAFVVEMPRQTPEGERHDKAIVYQAGRQVWLNASALKEGASAGSKLYAAVGNWAKNAGLVFGGDPLGLSDVALLRRTELMLSMGLKHGGTEFMEPHPRQVAPALDAGQLRGVRPVDWRPGADDHNLVELLKTSYNNVVRFLPEIRNVVFQPHSGKYVDVDTGKPITDEQWAELQHAYTRGLREAGLDAGHDAGGQGGDGSAERSGEARGATLKRAAFTNTFLRAESSAARRGILAFLGGKLSGAVDGLPGVENTDLRGLLYQSARNDSVPELERRLTSEFPGLKLDLSESSNGDIVLSRIVVPEELRNSGIGTQAMHAITDYADANGVRVTLSPSADFGGSKSRLVKFYKRFGFVENKGKGRDLSTSETMLRDPESSKFYQPAFHGSPYHFDNFTLDHIGNGEGAQAYGWGLYFAGSKEVAQYYRDTLGASAFQYDGKPLAGESTLRSAVELLWSWQGDKQGALDDASGYDNSSALKSEIRKLDFSKIKHGGQLYEVGIPDDKGNYLLWDKPFSEQPEAVKEAIEKHFKKDGDTAFLDAVKKYDGGDSKAMKSAGFNVFDYPGAAGALYERIASLHSPRVASQALNRLGVAGIKYLDESSRAAGEGSHNYVIFDDKAVQILKKFYQGAGERGSYSPDTATISLGKSSDLSTFPHELAHHFLEMTTELAGHEDAPAAVRDDMDALLRWFGTDGENAAERLANWTKMSLEQKRNSHEQFAEGFEKYLMEGKAPTVELQPLFARLRSWMLAVYKSLSNMGVQLNDEVRGVFDRMLASNEAIKRAEQVRGYEPLFTTAEEAGMTDQQFEEYRGLGQRATDEAVADMTARSLRDMKWLDNARSKAISTMQREAATERKAIREEVTKEVEALPVNKAREWLKNGRTVDEHGNEIQVTDEARKGAKLNADDVARLYPKDELGAVDLSALRGMTSKEGLHPDMVAEMFGYTSGQDLLRDLLTAPVPKDQIAQMTNQRMLERHGDLTDPAALQRAAEEAIHNEARARFVATGLKILTKSPLPARQIAQAAKEAAEAAIAAKKVGELRPLQYTAAEARANREALKLVAKEPAKAAASQRAALLNNRLARAAADAVTDVQKGVKYLKRFDKATTRGNIAPEHMEQIDGLLSRFDLKQTPTQGQTKQQANLQTWIESQRAAGYDPVMLDDMVDPSVRMHYKAMTVEQFRGLVDAVKAIEHIGRDQKTIMVDGKRMAIDALVQQEFLPKMRERDDKFGAQELVDPPRKGVDPLLDVALHRMGVYLRTSIAWLKPQDFNRNFFDRHELAGPFGKYIFDRIFDRNYWKVDQLKMLSNEFKAAADDLGRDWQKSLNDMVKNDTLMDPTLSSEEGKPIPMRITRGRLIGIARHVGNESNFDKLTRGMGWKPEDVWTFLHDNMTEKDWKAVQTEWDLYEKHWPDMEAMAKRLGNMAPEKIALRPFKTKFGEMRGGYAPIEYDPLRSKLSRRLDADTGVSPTDSLFDSRNYYRATTTRNGSMVNRAEGYSDVMNLDYHYIERRLHDTIHDLAYREALIDANKIIMHGEFRQQFLKSYGKESYDSLKGWMRYLANAENTDRTLGPLNKALAYTRHGMVMTGIAFRLSTVLVHGGSAGIKTMGYFAGGGEKYLAKRMAQIATPGRIQMIEDAQQKFPEIRARLLQQDRDFQDTSRSMFEPESFRSQAERFGHAFVAWSDMMTAIPTAWAAYDRAVTEGIPVDQGGTGRPMTDDEAVRYANKIVREAHGGNTETNRSMVMHGSEGLKLFTTIYGFMNNTFGQIADFTDKLSSNGINKPVILARAFAAIIVPALWTEMVKKGKPKEGESWAEWAAKAVAGEVAGTVPFVRDVAHMVEGFPSAGVITPFAWAQSLVKVAKDAVDYAQGKPVSHPIKDVANAAGPTLLIPGLGQAGASAQYMQDVHNGKEHPRDTLEYLQGVALGHGPRH